MIIFRKLKSNHLPCLSRNNTKKSIWFLYEENYSEFERTILNQYGHKNFFGDDLLVPAKICIEYSSLVLITTIYTLQDFYSKLPSKFIDLLLDTFSSTVKNPCYVISKELYFGKSDFEHYAFINSVLEYITDCFSHKIVPYYYIKLDFPSCSTENIKKILSYMYNHFVYFIFSDIYKITSHTVYPPLSTDSVCKARNVYNALIKFTLNYTKELLLFIRDGHISR